MTFVSTGEHLDHSISLFTSRCTSVKVDMFKDIGLCSIFPTSQGNCDRLTSLIGMVSIALRHPKYEVVYSVHEGHESCSHRTEWKSCSDLLV